MSLLHSPSEHSVSAPAAAGSPAPIAGAAAFRAAHGDPVTWSPAEFEVYLDLQRACAAPSGGEAA